MKHIKSLIILAGISQCFAAEHAIDRPIFDNKMMLKYFATVPNVHVEIRIEPANGLGGVITLENEFAGSAIPKTMGEIYAIFPDLEGMIAGGFPPDYYLRVSETLSRVGSRERVTSFIGTYARDLLLPHKD